MSLIVPLNHLYHTWKHEPSPESEAKFFKGLMQFCRYTVKKRFPETHYYDECVNDAMIDILKGLSTYESDKSSFVTWVTQIVLNRCYHAQDDTIARNEYPLFDILGCETHLEIENKLTMKALVKKLSPEDQNLIALKLQGYEESEIAEQLGQSEIWVDHHYRRAVASMKQYTEQKYLGKDPISKVEPLEDEIVMVTLEDGRSFATEKANISSKITTK